MALTQVNSEGIKDGEIKDADVNASAAIAGSKLAAATTSAAGSMSAADKTKLDGVATSATANPSAPALTGSTNNTITTVTGANAIQGEANLVFNGTSLGIGTDSPSAFTPCVHMKGTDPCLLLEDSATAVDYYGMNIGSGSITTWFDDAAYFGIGTAAGLTGASYSEKLRIDSSGRLLLGTTSVGWVGSDDLTVAGSADVGITIRSGDDDFGTLAFADGTSGADGYRGFVQYKQSSEYMTIGTNGTQRLRIDSDGLKFGSDSAAANALDDYEEGTFTPYLAKASATGIVSSYTTRTGKYIKIGKKVWLSIYIWIASGSHSTGGSVWFVGGLPFSLTTGSSGGYQFIPVGYWAINNASVANNNSNARLQSNNVDGADTLSLYGVSNTTNWTTGYFELSATGSLEIA